VNDNHGGDDDIDDDDAQMDDNDVNIDTNGDNCHINLLTLKFSNIYTVHGNMYRSRI